MKNKLKEFIRKEIEDRKIMIGRLGREIEKLKDTLEELENLIDIKNKIGKRLKLKK